MAWTDITGTAASSLTGDGLRVRAGPMPPLPPTVLGVGMFGTFVWRGHTF